MFLALYAALVLAAEAELPQVLDDRLQIQLVASDPDVRTTTGIAVDERGRVLVIESHTHFPPANYDGPKADRILLLDDFDPATGKARKISTFFEGTTHTMSLAVYHDGSIYVATRMEIFRLRDKDGDGKSDERTPICHLDTPGNYPHNGLSGLAFDFAGNVYFGFGENLGAEYKLIGSDGKTLKGGGEGGNIYCCDPDGKNVRRVATGFWNPFGLGFDAFGRLFAVDNDPDSRPPCRLLHIVEGGDYGFRFRNGRKGVHPFTAWNGELPGTLPMVAGTGEAPCAVMAYESDNLPEEYRGDLLVTSWGDHRLERYRLRPRGASFGAEMTPIIRGGENFRPVGLALAPDGSLYLSDWVDKSYNLHGKGRVWRVSAKKPAKPSRPKDQVAAISSPHGPWREAAARKLAPEQCVSIVTNSADERARSIAGRATFWMNERWQKIARQSVSDVQSDDEFELLKFARLAEAIARFKPNDFEQAASLSDQYARLALEELSNEQSNKLIDDIARWERNRYVGDGEPIELRLAMLDLVRGISEVDQDTKLLETSADPFIQTMFVRYEANRVRNTPAHYSIGLFELLYHIVQQTPQGKIGSNLEGFKEKLRRYATSKPHKARILASALRFTDKPEFRPTAVEMLNSPDETTRLCGVLWVGEARLADYRGELERTLKSASSSRQLFEAALAALALLDGQRPANAKDEFAGEEYVARLLLDDSTPAEIRRLALRILRADHPALTVELVTKLLADADEAIRLEAIRTLRQRPDSERWPQLREIAADEKAPAQLRCEAILGISLGNDDDRKLLVNLAHTEPVEVADEALRALRGIDLEPEDRRRITELATKLAGSHKELAERVLLKNPPQDLPKHEDAAAWLKLAEGDGNPQAGERIFFHLRVGGCFRCHEFEGRGYTIGPDLSNIGRSMTRERLVQSLVDPSREIAPQFTSWSILKTNGEVLTGIHVGDEVDGRMKFADTSGRAFHVHPNDIDQRKPSDQSIMPEGLVDNLTAQELRDLIAFLMREKAQ